MIRACQEYANQTKKNKKASTEGPAPKLQRQRQVQSTCGGVNDWMRKMGLPTMNQFALAHGGRGGPII